jgi:hypothetical protein
MLDHDDITAIEKAVERAVIAAFEKLSGVAVAVLAFVAALVSGHRIHHITCQRRSVCLAGHSPCWRSRAKKSGIELLRLSG